MPELWSIHYKWIQGIMRGSEAIDLLDAWALNVRLVIPANLAEIRGAQTVLLPLLPLPSNVNSYKVKETAETEDNNLPLKSFEIEWEDKTISRFGH